MSIFHSGIDLKTIGRMCKNNGGNIHFVGIGGVGMYPLAVLMRERGLHVSGSDARASALTEDLQKRGIEVRIGSAPELVESADMVVYTLAVSENDPEIKRAETLGIPIASRAEMLGALMENYSVRLGISGSHGKSTVTAMTDSILCASGKSPTTVIGAILKDTGLPLRIGSEDILVYEACEYKDSFLRFSPSAAVYTSLELDHTDYFKNLDALASSFRQSILSCPLPVLSLDDENISLISRGLKRTHLTYGEKNGDITAVFTRRDKGRYSLKIRHASGVMPEILLNVPALYNAKNALSAAALALSIGVDEDSVCRGLSRFSGIGRRMEYLGMANDHPVYYDYAHHPTEVRSAITGIREALGLPVTVIFKPHTYSRTLAFLSEFAASLSLADRVILLEVDPVREERDSRVNSQMLAERIGKGAAAVREEDALCLALSPGTSAVVLMGAANVENLLLELKNATRVTKTAGNGEE